MKMKSVKQIARHILKLGAKHGPEIAIGTGLVGMLGALIACSKEAPVADEKIREASEAKGAELTTTEKVQATWKVYFPAVMLFVISGACIIGASSVNLKRNTALAAAYSLAESQINELEKRRCKEIEASLKGKDENVVETKTEDGATVNNIIVSNQSEEEWFYDPLIREKFKSTKADIKNRIANLNTDMANGFDNSRSVNDYAFALNGVIGPKAWDKIGWNPSKDGRLVEIDFMPGMDPQDNKLLWTIIQRNEPFYDFV